MSVSHNIKTIFMLGGVETGLKPVSTWATIMEKEAIELLQTTEKPCWLVIVGQSMRPFIEAGDQAMILPVLATKIRIGDIISFVSDSHDQDDQDLVCHRVIGRFWKNGDLFFKEKGDNNRKIGTVPSKAVLGKVVRIVKVKKTNPINLETPIQRSFGFLRAIYSYFKQMIYANYTNNYIAYVKRADSRKI